MPAKQLALVLQAPPPNSGRVLVYRVANFGSDLSMVVSVDGRDVGSFTEGNNYAGFLPAGQHHLTVRVEPNRTAARPGRSTVNVISGRTIPTPQSGLAGI